MHRQFVLVAIACLSTAGCAKNSATVAGDPFLSPRSDFPIVAEQVDTVTNGQIPAIDNANEAIGVEGVPDGTQVRQTVFIDRDGQQMIGADVADPVTTPPDKAEWWKSQAAVDATAKDGIQIPPTTSVQGRVGTASISYGMGQISK